MKYFFDVFMNVRVVVGIIFFADFIFMKLMYRKQNIVECGTIKMTHLEGDNMPRHKT